jgi:NDP-sugar pyrophosphorylase family protein
MVLAAGRGTRLRPLTDRLPKCMVPVGGKPLLEHTIDWLQGFGVAEIIINLSHLPDVIRGHLGDGKRWGVQITYSLEAEPLGTAGGVKNAARSFDGPFFLWYGDNLSTCNLARLYEVHRSKGGRATIAVHRRDDPVQSGIVGLNENDRVVRFLEKPRPEEVFSSWVSAGIFVLERRVLDFIPEEGVSDFGRDVFPSMLTAGESLYGYRLSHDEGFWWADTPEDYEHARAASLELELARSRLTRGS